MCNNESCLGYFLLLIIILFATLIFFLLRFRKKILKQDLLLSADTLIKKLPASWLNQYNSKFEIYFGIWQDKTSTTSQFIIKDINNLVVGRIEYPLGQRYYRLFFADQIYTIELPITWGGMVAKLKSHEGHTLATFENKLFSLSQHKFIIDGVGILVSKRALFDLNRPIKYSCNGHQAGATYLISPLRRVGRIGFFPAEYPVPVKMFILAICS